MSYRDFMQQLVKMHPAAIDVFQKRTHGEWGIGIDAEPALDCWGIGLPGLDGMGLDRANTEMMGNTAAGYSSTGGRSEEHTSELQSLMRISYAVFCLKKKTKTKKHK